jgi:PIN domain nuclease of toxin-antitoxin system
VKILLDTHTWLWMMGDPDKLGPATQDLVRSGNHDFHVSIASIWELAIKHALGKLQLPTSPLEFARTRTHDNGINVLAISAEHACHAASLPRHHNDPFDRMLVAQADLEQHVLWSHDDHMVRYRVRVHDPAT